MRACVRAWWNGWEGEEEEEEEQGQQGVEIRKGLEWLQNIEIKPAGGVHNNNIRVVRCAWHCYIRIKHVLRAGLGWAGHATLRKTAVK